MTDEPNTLGEYLRARRELVTPEQAGIPVLGTRRVPGLRKVATVARLCKFWKRSPAFCSSTTTRTC